MHIIAHVGQDGHQNTGATSERETMPKSKKARKPQRKQRTKRRHLNCTCVFCRVGDPLLSLYMAENRDLFARALEANESVGPEEAQALRQGFALADEARNIENVTASVSLGIGAPTAFPGYVMMGEVSEQGDVEALSMPQLLDLWDVDTTDCGISRLRQRLISTMADQERQQQAPYNTLLWFAGHYDADNPTHVVVVTLSGQAAYLVGEKGRCAIPVQFMPQVLEMHRRAATQCVLDPEHGGTADARMLATVDHAGELLAEIKEKYLQTLRILEEMREAFVQAQADQREELTAAADARRRAAVASKEKELQAGRKRNEILSARLAESQKRIRELEALRAARGLHAEASAPADPGACVRSNGKSNGIHSGSALGGSSGECGDQAEDSGQALIDASAVPDAADDASHWQEIAEHQAAVIRQMRLAMQYSPSREQDASEPAEAPPRRLEHLASWAADNADRIVVLKRALQAAKKSTYENEELVYQALDMLATTYRDVKLSRIDRMQLKARCDELGLDIGGSISEAPGEAYFFDWKRKRVFLDQHLGRGTARDPRYCFRIYFTWDEEDAKVIVGWLPTHLPTRTT